MANEVEDKSPRAAELEGLHRACGEHLQTFVAGTKEFERVLSLEADIGIWLKVLDERPETAQYRSAHRDLGLAYYSIASGLYRQAFAGLRSFIEVSFGALHLSSAEYQRRRWVSGRRDLSWTEVTDADEGIFSINYVREFDPKAVEDAKKFRPGVRKAYRICSEYVHGNVETTALLPTGIKVAPERISEWSAEATECLLALHFGIFVRYYGELSTEDRGAVEPVLTEHLSKYQSVRAALGLPIEGTASDSKP